MVYSSRFEQFFMKSYVTLRWCSDGLDKQVVLGVTPLCLLLLICGYCTVTMQGTFIFWQVLKPCLRGRKHLAVFCPISGFPVLSPAVTEETHVQVPAALLPPRLSKLCTALGSLCKPLDHDSLGICCCDHFWEGGTMGIQTVGGVCKFQCLVWCLFCFSHSVG